MSIPSVHLHHQYKQHKYLLMGDLTIGLLGCIPKFQVAVLKLGGIVSLVFKIQIKVLVELWNEVFCVIVHTLMWC